MHNDKRQERQLNLATVAIFSFWSINQASICTMQLKEVWISSPTKLKKWQN